MVDSHCAKLLDIFLIEGCSSFSVVDYLKTKENFASQVCQIPKISVNFDDLNYFKYSAVLRLPECNMQLLSSQQ